VRLTTSPHSRGEFLEIWEPKPPGTLWTTPGLLRDYFTFTFYWFVFMAVLAASGHLVYDALSWALALAGLGHNFFFSPGLERALGGFSQVGSLSTTLTELRWLC
jgi:hypothetical protein